MKVGYIYLSIYLPTYLSINIISIHFHLYIRTAYVWCAHSHTLETQTSKNGIETLTQTPSAVVVAVTVT